MEQAVNDIQTWLPFVAAALPLVIGFLYKSSLSQAGKAAVMLVITAIAALANQVDANAGILTVEALYTWLGTTIVTIATYYGVWKPLGAGNVAPQAGIGPSD
jgi:hypothetical protein